MNPCFVLDKYAYRMLDTMPSAFAKIHGNTDFPNISGIVKFFPAPSEGLLVRAEVFHLPVGTDQSFPSFYGFHIHEMGDCSNNFANTGGHFNPNSQPHPHHAGDLPPLTSTDGHAWMCVYAQQLSIKQILGRSVVIHSSADDFTTQPSGNSGDKIACGVIKLMN